MHNAMPMHFQKERLPQKIKLFSLCAKSTQTPLKIELYVISPLTSHSTEATTAKHAPSFTAVYDLWSSCYDSKHHLGSPFLKHYHTVEQLQLQFNKAIQSVVPGDHWNKGASLYASSFNEFKV